MREDYNDPTHTQTLRKAYTRDFLNRVNYVLASVICMIKEPYAIEPPANAHIVANASPPPTLPKTGEKFQFMTKPQKAASFKKWIDTQVKAKLQQTDTFDIELPWNAKYLTQAYRAGAARAYTDTNVSRKRGLAPTKEFMAKSKDQFLRSITSGPVAMNKLKMLYSRSFTDLEGISSVMSTKMGRILADGLVNGLSTKEIAANLTNDIKNMSYKRAEMIAHTEIIHAHAEGQLDSYENLGVEQVTATLEIHTAGDKKVCKKCRHAAERYYTIEQARGILPIHSWCRCAWNAANVGANAASGKRSKRLGSGKSIGAAITRAVRGRK